jgi:uncharacterized membrane protein HdeD (DUF308 family)
MASPNNRNAPRMLERGILCIVIGGAVLLAPYFVRSAAWQEMVGGAQVVGWFAVVLGVALVVVELVQRGKRKAGR